jgi:hypothetical protein
MHEFLEEIANFIKENLTQEIQEAIQPEILLRIAKVLRKRHEEGWSLESDYKQTLKLERPKQCSD